MLKQCGPIKAALEYPAGCEKVGTSWNAWFIALIGKNTMKLFIYVKVKVITLITLLYVEDREQKCARELCSQNRGEVNPTI